MRREEREFYRMREEFYHHDTSPDRLPKDLNLGNYVMTLSAKTSPK